MKVLVEMSANNNICSRQQCMSVAVASSAMKMMEENRMRKHTYINEVIFCKLSDE